MELKPTNEVFLTVDENFRTASPSIYAIGDLIGGAMLLIKPCMKGSYASNDLQGSTAM